MRVTLVSCSQVPLNSICTAIAIMKEKDPLDYTEGLREKEKQNMVREILKSRLRGALEFASFEFLIEGVTRAFTHQLVRHRTFHFSQQSMRFFNAKESEFRMPKVDEFSQATIDSTVATIRESYVQLINHGCPTEDARSILPTNITTSIMFGTTLRGLIDLAEVRMCLQTQDEFREVMLAIKNEVSKEDKFLSSLLVVGCTRSGICDFKSIYDRECPIQKTLKGGK